MEEMFVLKRVCGFGLQLEDTKPSTKGERQEKWLCMPVRLEFDPALGGIDPVQIEALLPKDLTDRLAAHEEKLGLEELLYALGLHDWRERLDQLEGGGHGWGVHLALIAAATLLVLLVASCWLLKGAAADQQLPELRQGLTKPAPNFAKASPRQRRRGEAFAKVGDRESADGGERERRVRELRETERLREQERELQREADMSESKGRGEPKGEKGPKNPKSSAASQDIHVLARKGNLAGLRRLLERGMSVEERSKDSQKTPLHVACQFGQLNAVKMLHESFDADIEARTVHGRTPLHLAAAQGFDKVVEYLISRKADTTAVTPEGHNALQLSKKYSYTQVETVLTPR